MNSRCLNLFLILICFLSACSKSPTLPLTPEVTSTVTITPISVATKKPIKETPIQTKAIKYAPTVVQTVTAFPIATQTLASTITPTSTPQPTLGTHTWKLDNVLLQIERGEGDGCCWEVDPPILVLYSNGLLIRSKYDNGKYEMMARILKRNEMCALFNTLDQIGFLDYDPSVYQDPMAGAGNTFITVNIWKKQKIYGQFLDKWIYEGGDWWRKECSTEDCAPPPIILPALGNAYKLLDHYDPGELKRLSPQKLVLWATPEELDTQPIPWPIKELSLQEIAQKATEENSYAIFLDDPIIVRAIEGKVTSGFYIEGDVKRIVTVRPLWPGETHYGVDFSGLPTASSFVPNGTTMSCRPDDGLLPVPK